MVPINLFDNTFRQAACSVAGKIPLNLWYVRDRMEFEGITIFTDGYISDPIVDQVQCPYKVAWLHEPECLHPEVYANARPVLDKFDLALTYYDPFISSGLAQFAPYGGVWIDYGKWGLKDKTRDISMLYGAKMATEGHQLRHLISNTLSIMGMDGLVDFFGYKGEQVDYGMQTKWRVLGDYRFSIITEACRQDNLFTEILLDCFAVGTIPIFWGCPNVGLYFDERGILSFTTVNELLLMLKDCTTKLYESLQPYAAENYQLVKEYEVTEDWIYERYFRPLSARYSWI